MGDTPQAYRQGRKRRMTKFSLGEISGVDHPAQTPALAAIIKHGGPVDLHPLDGETVDAFIKRASDAGVDEATARAAFDEAVQKARGDIVDLLTGSTDGHQHGVRLYHDEDGLSMVVMMATSADGAMGHDHTLLRDGDGWVVSENAGHSHELSADAVAAALLQVVTKAREAGHPLTFGGVPVESLPEVAKAAGALPTHEDSSMSDDLQQRVDALAAENATLQAVVDLVPAHRAHYDSLAKAARPGFLALDFTARDEAIAKAAAADPVVYKSETTGREYRKSAGQDAIDLAKQVDELTKANATARAEAEDARITKRAEDIRHLPGDLVVHKAMLAAVDGIADEAARTKAHEALKAADDAMAKAFGTHGVNGSPDFEKGTGRSGAEAELEELTKARMTEHDEDYFTAYGHVSKANPTLAKRAIG